jgi:hypothetical protein
MRAAAFLHQHIRDRRPSTVTRCGSGRRKNSGRRLKNRRTPGHGFLLPNTTCAVVHHRESTEVLAQSLHDRPSNRRRTTRRASTTSNGPESHGRGYLYGTNEIFLRIDPTLPPDLGPTRRRHAAPPRRDRREPGMGRRPGISTAHDRTIWIDALVDGRVLNPEYQQKMLPGDPTDRPTLTASTTAWLRTSCTPTPHPVRAPVRYLASTPGCCATGQRRHHRRLGQLRPQSRTEAFIGALVNTIYRTPTTAPPRRTLVRAPILVRRPGHRRWPSGYCAGRSPSRIQPRRPTTGRRRRRHNPGAAPQPSDSAVFTGPVHAESAPDRPGTTL